MLRHLIKLAFVAASAALLAAPAARADDQQVKIGLLFDVTGPVANFVPPMLDAAKLVVDQFLLPIDTYVKSYLLTARQAANRMAENKSGVIMTVNPFTNRHSAYTLKRGEFRGINSTT